ncbi:MAG: sigma-70 family RNA polymerase sigma factor [Candidatus Eisenbacteria bacterium]|nr:sigma-70 family RNA polymerase sigma factor [Candidatus Eisenbacteria bacterium]
MAARIGSGSPVTDSTPSDPRRVVADLLPEVYEELRSLAAHYLRQERVGHTLQPTALVHEAFLKLSRQSRLDVNDRTHFLAIAAGAMRQVLVDHARAHLAAKRGGGWQRITVDESVAVSAGGIEDLLILDDTLRRLAELDEPAARIVEMRFFAGLTEAEIAQAMGMSERWVRGQWAFARAWLRREMTAE